MKVLTLGIFTLFIINSLAQDLYNYLEKRGVEAIREGDFLTAQEYLDTAIVLFPDSSELYFHRGGNYFLEDSILKAKSDFEIFIEKKPDDPKVRKFYGFVLHSIGDTSNARNNYESYLKYNSLDIEVIQNLAKLDWLQNKKDLSKKRMEFVFKLKPKDNYSARVFAHFLEENQAFTEAEKYYTKAIEIDSLDADGYLDRSKYYFNQKEKKKCCIDLKTVVEMGKYEAIKIYNDLKCIEVLGKEKGRIPPPPEGIIIEDE